MKDHADAVLYHYTDFRAFDGIVCRAQLRVNNVLNMNDAAEMRLFISGLRDAVLERLKRDGDQNAMISVRDLFEEELKKKFYYSAYAACFSLDRDDAAQWERYGNQGRGVCIGFHEELFRRIVQGALSLQTVFYQDDMRSHELVGLFYDMARRSSGDLAAISEVRQLMRQAWICSAAFKHPSFSSEKEVRLVISPFSKGFFDIEPGYHITTERIKKYYPLDLSQMCRDAGSRLEELISEIIIGPESMQSKSVLEDYLRDHGLPSLAERIVLSECPLRRTPNRT